MELTVHTLEHETYKFPPVSSQVPDFILEQCSPLMATALSRTIKQHHMRHGPTGASRA